MKNIYKLSALFLLAFLFSLSGKTYAGCTAFVGPTTAVVTVTGCTTAGLDYTYTGTLPDNVVIDVCTSPTYTGCIAGFNVNVLTALASSTINITGLSAGVTYYWRLRGRDIQVKNTCWANSLISGSFVAGTGFTCPTCNDGILNQTETAIDCGGVCAACSLAPSDLCTGAINLPIGGTATCQGSTVSAGNTGNPTDVPDCWTQGSDKTVWYKFTATSTSTDLKVNDAGNTYTPQVAVYDGGVSPGTCPAAGTVSPTAANCMAYSTNEATISLTTVIGRTYFIMLDMPSTIVTPFCIQVYSPPPATTSTSACSSTVNTIVNDVTCADVGTGAFNNTSGAISYSSGTAAANSTPNGGSTCDWSGSNDFGTWAHYDLASDVTGISLAFNSATSIANGNFDIYMNLYQGTSCAALSLFKCGQIMDVVMGSPGIYNFNASGLDPSQDLWVYMYGGGTFTGLNFTMVGTASQPSNNTCATAQSGSTTGCNVGAVGATFDTPGIAGVGCTGGTWGSNENTVFYSFTASATTASITVSNTVCNDGTAGSAQIGVWTSCACIGTYTTDCFKGCYVGTGTMTLTNLTVGSTYYFAIDGYAGDMCKFNFTTVGLIVLPVEFIELKGIRIKNKNHIQWTTASEENSYYFELERSIDGINFETIKRVYAAGNSYVENKYDISDDNSPTTTSYYKLKQMDKDGHFLYHGPIVITKNDEISKTSILPNPVKHTSELQFYSNSIDNTVITIIDFTGREIYNNKFECTGGNNVISIPTERFKAGIYFLNINNSESSESIKFFKE